MTISKKQVFGFITIACINLFLLELGAYLGLLYLQGKSCIYFPPRISPDEYAGYMHKRDEILGWPSPTPGKPCSPLSDPAFPDIDKFPSCVSLYGDSYAVGLLFTEPSNAWSSVLSNLLHCRVANFGIGGYGTDQAYLRFLGNTSDTSKVVILGFTTENALRNVNQYKCFLYYGPKGMGFGLKPRFIIGPDGSLQLIPLPKFSYDDFMRMTRFPRRYLTHEYFLPGGTSGFTWRTFPYTIALVKTLAKNFHIRAELQGSPWYREFYDPMHPSGSLQVSFGILNNFYLEAKKRDKTPVVVIIPTGLDLEYYRKQKKWVYGNLLKMLKEARIPFIDAGPKIIAQLNGKDPRTLFFPDNHLNPEGEKALGTAVYEYLKENKIFAP